MDNNPEQESDNKAPIGSEAENVQPVNSIDYGEDINTIEPELDKIPLSDSPNAASTSNSTSSSSSSSKSTLESAVSDDLALDSIPLESADDSIPQSDTEPTQAESTDASESLTPPQPPVENAITTEAFNLNPENSLLSDPIEPSPTSNSEMDSTASAAQSPDTAPTPTTEPTPMPTKPATPIVQSPTIAPDIPQQPAQKKRSKVPLIIAILLFVFAVCGLGFWFVYRNTSEVQAIDAINNLLSAKNVGIKGDVSISINDKVADNYGIKSVKLNFNHRSSHVPESNSSSLSIVTIDNSAYNLKLEETLIQDGTIYLKIDGVKDVINSDNLPSEVKDYLNYYTNTLNSIDGQWWMISVPDVISELNTKYNTAIDTKVADAYQCVVDHIAKNDNKELVKLYQDNPFIIVTPYNGNEISAVNGGNLFSLMLDQSKLESYYRGMQHTTYQSELSNCLSIASSYTNSSIDSSEDESSVSLNVNLPPIYLEISNWDHRLSRIYIPDIFNVNVASAEQSSEASFDRAATGVVDLHISYPDNVAIDTPNDAKPVTVLIDSIIDDTSRMTYDIYGVSLEDTEVVHPGCGSNTNCIDDERFN